MFKQQYGATDIRRALEAYRKTKSFRVAERICGIGKSSIQRWWVSFHTLLVRRKLQRRKSRRSRKPKYAGLETSLRLLFQSHRLKFLSLHHIQQELGYHKPPCISWISQALKKAKVSRRRFIRSTVCPRAPNEMAGLYMSFFNSLKCFDLEGIVCLDETAFSNVGNCTYGYFPKGKHPEIVTVPRRERFSLVMAIHPSKGIVASSKQKQAFNKDTFLAFVKDHLIPSIPHGTKAILMDNIRFHHSKEVIECLEVNGLFPLFIPPYSPRCNPIEELFSLLKHIFRSLDESKGTFLERVDSSIETLNRYKDMTPYYKHALEHVKARCHQTLES